ncbi:class II aldolase/adducin N-terminal [Trichophaea hybrida]|nr:class II aldolase/adducin N-terminal [Trichophaea hybrida]
MYRIPMGKDGEELTGVHKPIDRKVEPSRKDVLGVRLPSPPRREEFPTIEAHRAHIKSHMCAAFRAFASRGSNEGITQKHWTNPFGRHFAMMRPSDIVLVDEHGEPIDGNKDKPVNAAGYFIHSAVHRARPDIQAGCHMHTPEEEEKRLAASLGGPGKGKGKALILRNYGLMSVCGTVDEAAFLFIGLEQACMVQLIVEAALAGGNFKKIMIDDETAKVS